MDVASLIVWSLLGQTAPDPFGAGPPPVPNVAPMPTTPSAASAPGAAMPRYGAPSTAAADPRYAQPQPTAAQNYAAPPSYSPPPGYSAPPNNTAPPSYAAPAAAAPTGATAPPNYAAPPSYNAQPSMNVAAAATAPLQNNEDKSGAGDLVRESLVLPKSLALPGRVTSLDELFSHVGDRRRQIDAVRAYWKLTADVADYHFAWQHTQFLKLLSEVVDGVEKGPDLQRAKTETTSRFAEAQARQREAEMRLAAAQLELADRASLPTTNRQPLPKDLPHVGVYNTSFDKVYAHRTPPARAYLLNRTLPLWRDIIALRADTVWASQDAYDAAFDAYRKGQLEVDDVFLAVEELRERRSEFIGAVRRYNDEIAEYALTSAPEGTSRETLVGMLIKNSNSPKLGRAVVPSDMGDIQQVTYVDEFGNRIAAPIAAEGETLESIIVDPQTSIPRNVIPSTAIPSAAATPAAGDINLTSATLPITNLEDTSAGPAVPPARVADSTPNPFPPQAAAASIPMAPFQVTPSPLPNGGAAVPVRGEPTLAPPQQSTTDAPLKFKVNKAIVPDETGSDFTVPDGTAPQAPRQLPPEVHAEARPIEVAPDHGHSPYSSGTHVRRRSKAAASIHDTTVGDTTAGDAPVKPIVAAPTQTPTPETKPAAVPAAQTALQAQPKVEAQTTSIQVDPEVEQAGYYTQFAQLPSARRTQELVEMLHGTRGLPTSQDKPTTLDESMAGSEPSHRREIIQAYWRAAELATRYRVWTQKLERLDALGQSALQFRDKPAGSIAMLQIRAEKLAIEASRRSTLIDFAGAQWTLTNDTRRSLAGPWIIPSTSPHAGSYQTKVEALPAAASSSPRLQAAAERIPMLHETLLLRADAVAGADAASDQVLQKYAAGQTTIATALNALRREARTTHDLLATVTRYNLDIAEYALAAVPGSAPRDALVGALVVSRVRR